MAEPYVPKAGTQVLERLATRNDPVQRELSAARQKLHQSPENVALATDLARRYISLARTHADPRYLGYAQGVLAPWWAQARPPSAVLVLRATILQSTHRFAEARADLDLLLSIDRRNAQALLTRATVLQVQGNFDEAKKSCAQLYGIATDLIVRTCLASASNVSGGARASYASLKSALESSKQAAPDVQIWALTLLAEMASRMGNTAAAEMHFKDAFSLTRTDSYLLGAYADFLLNAGRYTAVVALLKDQTRADALLLRYALALDALRAPEALHAVSILRDRFEASLLRGDTVHQREQSRFELQLMKNPTRALQLAQANWMVQKEPADARILLEAAVGAADKSAAQPLLAWLSASGMEDVTLDRLKIALAKLP